MPRTPNRTRFEDRLDKQHDSRFAQLSKKGWNKLQAPEYDNASEHPTPEQLLIREAVKFLTPKQRAAWEYYNYDKLTMDEIAKKLRITQQSCQERIAGAEKKIIKWVRSNMGAYKLLKDSLPKK